MKKNKIISTNKISIADSCDDEWILQFCGLDNSQHESVINYLFQHKYIEPKSQITGSLDPEIEDIEYGDYCYFNARLKTIYDNFDVTVCNSREKGQKTFSIRIYISTWKNFSTLKFEQFHEELKSVIHDVYENYFCSKVSIYSSNNQSDKIIKKINKIAEIPNQRNFYLYLEENEKWIFFDLNS